MFTNMVLLCRKILINVLYRQTNNVIYEFVTNLFWDFGIEEYY